MKKEKMGNFLNGKWKRGVVKTWGEKERGK